MNSCQIINSVIGWPATAELKRAVLALNEERSNLLEACSNITGFILGKLSENLLK
jgi:hypothetical protein